MNIKTENKYLIVELDGEIDEYVCSDLKEDIDIAYNNSKAIDMIFDFKKTTFIDSSGVGMILGRYKKVAENRGRVFISGATNQVDKVFAISDIYRLIPQYKNIHDITEVR